jgi:hypothetical protein
MSEKNPVLKIFNYSHPLLQTELLSLLGDKYVHALPFPWEFVQDLEAAEVVVWDGVMSPRNKYYTDELLRKLETKVLLLTGEAMTSLKASKKVSLVDESKFQVVRLTGWNVLPEEILSALEAAYKKLHHV